MDARGLYDPGANITMITSTFLHKLKANDIHFANNVINKNYAYKTMSGEHNSCGIVFLRMKIFEIERISRFFVIDKDNFNYDVLLGLDSILDFRLRQDENLKISQAIEGTSKENRSVQKQIPYINWNEYLPIEEFDIKTEHLDKEKRQAIYELVDKYGTCFAKNKFDIGQVKDCEAQIKLTNDTYVAKRPYRCSFEDQKEIQSQVAELLKHGIIEESYSPFASPVTMAYKKEGSERVKTRLCIDFRELNKLIVPESQPFPLIDDLIVQTKGCHWFSSFDINSAFWTIPIRHEDRHKTGFVTSNGHYQWATLPFGLKNAPAVFQRILSGIIRRYGLSDFCSNYIDDVLIFSRTFQEHLNHIALFLETIHSEGFRLKFSKCAFATNEVRYLGHVIGHNTVHPLTDNLTAIRNFPTPRNRKNIRQFLGKINFYNKYIPNTAQLLEPFHNLLRKNVEFVWDECCQITFESVKNYLTTPPVLAIFDRDAPINIYTDASSLGIGAVLKQPQKDGIEKPVAYFSRKLTDSQKKKKAIYIECIAIREAIRCWQYWLMGKRFRVFTDHKPLENLRIRARTDEELGELTNYLLQFDCEVIYKPGVSNSEADCLSRNPVLESWDQVLPDTLKVVNVISLEEIKNDQSSLDKSNLNCKHGVYYKTVRKRSRIFLSESLGKDVIRRTHEHYGHIGTKHILNMLQPSYYFPKMKKHTESYCASCDICIRNKTRIRREKGVIGHLGPPTEPFQIMSLDTIGGFGGRRSTKRYLHLLVDHFSRYAYISTSANQTSYQFIKLLEKVSAESQIGLLLTDQYGGLTSTELEQYLVEKNIEHLTTSVDMPSSNGINERLNQTLVNRIRCRINEFKSKVAWSTIAAKCVQEYNDTVHSVTGFTPSYLMYGKEPDIVPNELRTPRDYQADRRQAYSNTLKNHEENKNRLSRNRKIYEFKVGDLVYVEVANAMNRHKLGEIRLGPFPIIEKRSANIYVIRIDGRKRSSQLYHVSKLVPFVT